MAQKKTTHSVILLLTLCFLIATYFAAGSLIGDCNKGVPAENNTCNAKPPGVCSPYWLPIFGWQCCTDELLLGRDHCYNYERWDLKPAICDDNGVLTGNSVAVCEKKSSCEKYDQQGFPPIRCVEGVWYISDWELTEVGC